MISHLDSKDPNYFQKRLAEKEKNRMEEYKSGKIVNNFEGANKRARIIRNAPKPEPL
jgi:hypothetical protein